MKKFLVFLSILTALCGGKLLSQEPEILFLSTPRSGTHWALYCLCSLLDREMIHDRGPAQVDIFSGIFSKNSTGVIYAAHNPKDLWIKKNGDQNDILVFILRNYRECLLRNHETPERVLAEIKGQTIYNRLDNDKNAAFVLQRNDYFNNLRCYDLWHPSKRFLIYYEDLVLNPEPVLRQIAQFFNVPDAKLQSFLDNIDFHFQRCLKIYDKQGGSHSKGTDVLFHSKKIGSENCVSMDATVKTLYPNYFYKYLKRYELLHDF